jgi:hypothetical protein
MNTTTNDDGLSERQRRVTETNAAIDFLYGRADALEAELCSEYDQIGPPGAEAEKAARKENMETLGR